MRGIILGVALLLAFGAARADAYKLSGERWPGRTITYYDASGLKFEVETAVRAWNASGVRIRFKPASKARAQVLVVRKDNDFCMGFGQLGYSRFQRAKVSLSKCQDRWANAAVATHEFGHILGLDHESRRCAAMNPTVQGSCPRLSGDQYRCRLLEPDDLKGAIKRYGGRARKLGPETCPLYAPPGALTGLTFDPLQGELSVGLPAKPKPLVPTTSWGPTQSVQVAAGVGACPADVAALFAGELAEQSVYDQWGERVSLWAPVTVGPWCIAARLVDAAGRSGPVTSAQIVVPLIDD